MQEDNGIEDFCLTNGCQNKQKIKKQKLKYYDLIRFTLFQALIVQVQLLDKSKK